MESGLELRKQRDPVIQRLHDKADKALSFGQILPNLLRNPLDDDSSNG